MILHITNGDCAIEVLRRGGLQGDTLSWGDVLHDGPVPAGFDHEELTELRAQFIASCGWAGLEEVRAQLGRRNAAIACAKTYREVVLWFEHDLFDQLQLIQILDWFTEHGVGWTEVRLVQAASYLGSMEAQRVPPLYEGRARVTRGQYVLAREAWAEFRAPAPGGLARFFAGNGALPYLGPALRRFAEEYPWVDDGLGRTERAILEAVGAGVRDDGELFRAYAATEDPLFMGDLSFFWRLRQLKDGEAPLLTATNDLTPAGAAVLRGEADAIEVRGIDRWLGGVWLKGADSPWRWDPRQKQFVSRP